MPVRTLRRKHETVTYSASQESRVRLSRGALMRELYLQLNMGLSAANANPITRANLLPGDEWGVVQEIRLEANNNQILYRVSGEQLRWMNSFVYGNFGRVSLPAGVAADATATIASTLRMPFWSIGTHTPNDTLLDTRKMSQLDLVIKWGTAASITSATSASFGTNPSIVPISFEQDEATPMAYSSYQYQPISYNTVPVQDTFRVELPVNCMYRGFYLQTKDASSLDVASNYISNIKLVSGPTVYFDMPAKTLQDLGYLQSGLVLGNDDAGTAIDDPFASENSDIYSHYFIDLLADGGKSPKYLTECIDALGLSELTLELNVTTQIPKLNVIPFKLFPVRKKG